MDRLVTLGAMLATLGAAIISSGCFGNSSPENVVRTAYLAVKANDVARLRKTLAGEALNDYGSADGLKHLSQLLGTTTPVIRQMVFADPEAEKDAEFIRVDIGKRSATGDVQPFLVSHVSCVWNAGKAHCHILLIETACAESQQLIDSIIREDTRTFIALVNSGADLDGANDDGVTPLMAAAQFEKLDVVQILLNRGVNVNARDIWNYSALDRAKANGNSAIVNLLLGAGAR